MSSVNLFLSSAADAAGTADLGLSPHLTSSLSLNLLSWLSYSSDEEEELHR